MRREPKASLRSNESTLWLASRPACGRFDPGAGASAQTAEDCGNLPGTSTTRDLDQCYHAIYQQADAELNTVYRQLTDKLSDPSERDLLRDAEQAWVQYRDKECAFETAGTREGTIHPIEVSVCLTEKTRAHIEELQHQLNCSDGDPTCMHRIKEGGG